MPYRLQSFFPITSLIIEESIQHKYWR